MLRAYMFMHISSNADFKPAKGRGGCASGRHQAMQHLMLETLLEPSAEQSLKTTLLMLWTQWVLNEIWVSLCCYAGSVAA